MTTDFDMAAGRAYDALARLNGYDQARLRGDERLLRDLERAPLVDVDDPDVEARLDAAWDSCEERKERLR